MWGVQNICLYYHLHKKAKFFSDFKCRLEHIFEFCAYFLPSHLLLKPSWRKSASILPSRCNGSHFDVGLQ